MDLFDQEIIHHIRKLKYAKGEEKTPADIHARVVSGIYANDPEYDTTRVLEFMNDFGWVPGGRILAGAGTKTRVTLLNCFVNQRVPDSMDGIMDSLNIAAFTQQQGGGIGTGFSSIRPAGARVVRTATVSSGILPFMDMWNAMCATVKSSGSRRGAMMATLACWHPDLPAFIKAKQQEGRLTNFNVSVLVTDKFMLAVKNDWDWELGFHVPPADIDRIVASYPVGDIENFTTTRWWREMFLGYDPCTWYVYRRMKARELWDSIIKNTYDWAEPGVIFIDRVNQGNNLNYCEYIDCTNPCGEQPLPPNGDCDLGAVNLATCVMNPFTRKAAVNYPRIDAIVREGVRFLDNVMDVSIYPTKNQELEAKSKRRIGLGILGLGNLFQQLCVRYGSQESIEVTENVMRVIAHVAYRCSAALAKERKPFPAYASKEFLNAEFVQTLPPGIRNVIENYGIRNGVLLTIAPTGTTAMHAGNVSSGCEPSFSWIVYRKILQDERDELARDQFKEFRVEDYGFRAWLYHSMPEEQHDEFRKKVAAGEKVLPPYMVTALELSVNDHLEIQEACQKYVDASISKTINCPQNMTFDDFQAVYLRAYELKLKGCTTYRPSNVRGAILSLTPQLTKVDTLLERPEKLFSTTYKKRWPNPTGGSVAYYITISDTLEGGERRPFEIFINSMDVSHFEWIVALTRTISSIFRRNKDVRFLVEELKQVHSPVGGMFLEGKYVHSLVALIGEVIQQHIYSFGGSMVHTSPVQSIAKSGEVCPECKAPTLFHEEGCSKCASCAYTTCG